MTETKLKTQAVDIPDDFREKLTGNRTYYVATTGSDSNDGLSSGAPFLTIQKAWDVIEANLDLAGYTVSVDLENGTYTAGLSISGGWTGGGAVTFTGDTTTPSNVLISVSSGNAIYINGNLPGILTFEGIKIVCSSGIGLYHEGIGIVSINNIDFGACASAHTSVGNAGAKLQYDGNWTISGNSGSHWFNYRGGQTLVSSGFTCTLSGTPAFSNGFAFLVQKGLVRLNATTFSGSATGKYFSIGTDAMLVKGSTQAIPGDTPGVYTGGNDLHAYANDIYDLMSYSYTQSLLHFEEVDTSTTFKDEKGLTWTASGNAQIDTAQKKFGGASLLLDGTGDYITTPDAHFWTPTGDFTFDCWCRWNALPATGGGTVVQNITGHSTTGGYGMGLQLWVWSGANTVRSLAWAHWDGTTTIQMDKDVTSLISTGTWYHVAVTRSGSAFALFLDGVKVATATNSASLGNFASAMHIGYSQFAYLGSIGYFNGWIDEFRYVNGYARWTDDFTPPTRIHGV